MNIDYFYEFLISLSSSMLIGIVLIYIEKRITKKIEERSTISKEILIEMHTISDLGRRMESHQNTESEVSV